MILFVDDERRKMDSYKRELDISGYNVVFESNIDHAKLSFDKNALELEMLILDIMMPPGKLFRGQDTDDGLRTGVHFYDMIRKVRPELPVIILTNVTDERVMERFRGENACWYLPKEDYLPFELVREVDKILH